jgi:serine/threonine protein kinase
MGKYRVEKSLGQGGTGVVVSAFHVDLRQRVAIKMLLPAVLANEIVVERFLREARAAVKLESDYVVKVIDVGRLESGTPYMVMEHLEGRDLADLIDEYQRLPPPTAVDYALQAIDALAEAHASDIVHRDLKLSNLFLTARADGTRIIKVLDFGIAKFTEAGSDELTGTKVLLGSPHYMSPEQFRAAKTVDHRTDIWALGIILYRMVCGRMPFRGSAPGQLYGAVLTTPPAPIVEEGVPPGLAEVILRCLRREPSERFSSVAHLAEALLPFGTGQFQRCCERARKFLPSEGTPPVVPSMQMPEAPEMPVRPRMHWRLGAIVAGAVALLGSLVLFALAKDRSSLSTTERRRVPLTFEEARAAPEAPGEAAEVPGEISTATPRADPPRKRAVRGQASSAKPVPSASATPKASVLDYRD